MNEQVGGIAIWIDRFIRLKQTVKAYMKEFSRYGLVHQNIDQITRHDSHQKNIQRKSKDQLFLEH